MTHIDQDLLDLFACSTHCEYCERQTPEGCSPHHFWKRRGAGGGTRLDIPINLIALCWGWYRGRWSSCHDLAHEGKLVREDFLPIVARREQRSAESIIDEINWWLRQPKETRYWDGTYRAQLEAV